MTAVVPPIGTKNPFWGFLAHGLIPFICLEISSFHEVSCRFLITLHVIGFCAEKRTEQLSVHPQ